MENSIQMNISENSETSYLLENTNGFHLDKQGIKRLIFLMVAMLILQIKWALLNERLIIKPCIFPESFVSLVRLGNMYYELFYIDLVNMESVICSIENYTAMTEQKVYSISSKKNKNRCNDSNIVKKIGAQCVNVGSRSNMWPRS